MDEIYMEKWRAAFRKSIWNDFLGIYDFTLKEKMFDFDCELAVMCAMNILTQNIERYKWPRNWKEAVKERWLPAWILKRFPVKYTVIDVKAIYPKAKWSDPIFKAEEVKDDPLV